MGDSRCRPIAVAAQRQFSTQARIQRPRSFPGGLGAWAEESGKVSYARSEVLGVDVGCRMVARHSNSG